jgi:hypothetical protein
MHGMADDDRSTRRVWSGSIPHRKNKREMMGMRVAVIANSLQKLRLLRR